MRARARPHALRAAVRAARDGAARRTSRRRRAPSRRCTTQVQRAAAGDVHAQQGVVGDAQALRRSGAPAGTAPLNRALLELDGQPAGYALYRVQAGLAARLQQGDGDDLSRSSHRRPRPPASCGGGSSTSTGRRSSSPTCCRSTIRCSCCSPSRAGCSSRSTTVCGCGCSTCPARSAARTYAEARSGRARACPIELVPENAGRWRVIDRRRRAHRGARPICGSTSPSSARCISAASASPISPGHCSIEELNREPPRAPMRSSAPTLEPWCAEIF